MSSTYFELIVSIEHTLPPARLLTPMYVNLPYKFAFYSSLPEDELMRFKTCRGGQKFKKKKN